ncbi:MAG: hypothetical protein ACK57G_20580 [Planctomycetota bacterium]|jgi:hypothetical protein
MNETTDTNHDKPLGPAFYVGLALMLISDAFFVVCFLFLFRISISWSFWLPLVGSLGLLLLRKWWDHRLFPPDDNRFAPTITPLLSVLILVGTIVISSVTNGASWYFHPLGVAMACQTLVIACRTYFKIFQNVTQSNAVLDPPVTPHDESQALNPYAPPMLAKPQASDADLGSYGRPELPEIPDPG